MDKRKNYYIIFDTETCNSYINEKGKPELKGSLVYDIGWMIIDKKGNVYESRSFVVGEIFFGERDMMDSAYYAHKLPLYFEGLKSGEYTAKSLYHIRKIFLDDCEKYSVKAAIAHNARFDLQATNNTQRWLTKSKYRYFLPYGLPLYDTLQMARDTFGKEKTYRRWCERNDYMTPKTKQPRMTAEVLYRYISGEHEFDEQHMGLADVTIEKEIFVACMAKHKRMRKELFKRG